MGGVQGKEETLKILKGMDIMIAGRQQQDTKRSSWKSKNGYHESAMKIHQNKWKAKLKKYLRTKTKYQRRKNRKEKKEQQFRRAYI